MIGLIQVIVLYLSTTWRIAWMNEIITSLNFFPVFLLTILGNARGCVLVFRTKTGFQSYGALSPKKPPTSRSCPITTAVVRSWTMMVEVL